MVSANMAHDLHKDDTASYTYCVSALFMHIIIVLRPVVVCCNLLTFNMQGPN